MLVSFGFPGALKLVQLGRVKPNKQIFQIRTTQGDAEETKKLGIWGLRGKTGRTPGAPGR